MLKNTARVQNCPDITTLNYFLSFSLSNFSIFCLFYFLSFLFFFFRLFVFSICCLFVFSTFLLFNILSFQFLSFHSDRMPVSKCIFLNIMIHTIFNTKTCPQHIMWHVHCLVDDFSDSSSAGQQISWDTNLKVKFTSN